MVTMKCGIVLGTALLILEGLAALLPAQNPEPPAATFRLGGKVDNLTLGDLRGQAAQLFDLGRDAQATVALFIATQCPVSNDYNERMAALEREYSAKGIKFLAINSNRQEPGAEIADHAARHGFGFAVYKDENNVLADLLGASVTPEAYLFDRSWTMRYHGRIDDHRAVAKVTVSDLRNALIRRSKSAI